jgi:transcriptional regulator with XRE-family HTH domain
MTQRELADFSTISERAIRDLESGKARRPRLNTVRLIAEALRLGPSATATLTSAAHPIWAGYDDETAALPTPVDPIIGREQATVTLAGELADGVERLVNIVGLSGVGKTRLALEVANRLHADGDLTVLWYSCADVPDGIENTIGDRPTLLVADDVDGAEPPGRLARLLRMCPGLRILATSDRVWGLPQERIFLLDPLTMPRPGDERDEQTLRLVPSVRLFIDRVRRVRPHYTLEAPDLEAVADICRQVDGLPEALRAVAAWLVVYELDTLHRCLDSDPEGLLQHVAGPDGDGRYRDRLRRPLDRLPAEDRTLLAALCELGGEFELADVAALTGSSLPDAGRMVRGLLLHGVVRPWYEAGQHHFDVLNLVLACHLTSPLPTLSRA